MDILLIQLRQSLRRLAGSAGFTVTAIATLAIGIGAFTVMFSVVDGILLRPLPYPEPDRLVRVHQASPERGVEGGAVSLPDFTDWQEQNSVFSSLGAYYTFSRNMTGTERPVSLGSTYVSEGFFQTLGSAAALGRVPTPGEVRDGLPAVVLSHAVWREHFGGDPAVIGAPVSLDGMPYTVVGVMPSDFRFPEAGTGVWLPLPLLTSTNLVPLNRSARWLSVVGRLHPEATREEAALQMSAIAEQLAVEYPASNEGWTRATVPDLRQTIVGDVRPALAVALAAVLLVLVMVCANLASLLLARATARSREMALRAAVGANRQRLMGELLTDSLVLALLGGATGVILAAWAMGAVRGLILPILPRVEDLGIDLRVLAVSFVITLLTSVLFGILPALQAGRPDLRALLQERGASGAGHGRRRIGSAVVVGQVAFALVLTIGAGLLLRNFRELRGIEPGFNPQGVLRAQLQLPLPPDRAELRGRIVGTTEQILERLRALPGVEAVGTINALPLRDGSLLPISVGESQAAGQAELLAEPRSVSGDYFRVMQIPLLAGERFPEHIGPEEPTIAIVSQTTARRLWPGEDPVGREFWMGIPYRVVGVVSDVRGASLTGEPPLTVYRLQRQQPLIDVTFVLRTQGDPRHLSGAVREAIWSVDRGQPISRLGPLSDVVSEALAQDRFFTLLFGAFGTVALLLAALGLYGVLAYMVTQQTREIAVRRALGADPFLVLKMVLGRGMRLAVIGVVLGIPAALVLTRLLTGMLHRVNALDPATYAAVIALLLLTAMLAVYGPARRAMRTDPMLVLRAET